MPLTSGSRLGAYEIIALIGAGGMGEVYRARDTRLDRIVAVKVLPAELADDPQFRERFDREARTISQLDHPHICALYDIGTEGNAAYLVMQHLDGETLADRLGTGALPIGDALKIAIEIATALDTAHSAGIIHRDLKPGNVFLTATGAKLLDFGLAKSAAPAISGLSGSRTPAYMPTGLPTTPPALTAQGTILGTFQYMAPEQLEGRDADARTDLFAFGAVVYEMITGRKAFQGQTQVSLIGAILKDEPPPMSTVQRLAPASLDWVVRKCLAKNPAARWQSARDVVGQLEWIAQGGSEIAPAPTIRPRARWREWAAWSTAATLAAALTGLVILYGRRQAPDPAQVRFEFAPPADTEFPGTLVNFASQAVSPDGRLIALVLTSGGRDILAIRPIDMMQIRIIPGTDGANAPFWGPDSRTVAFFAQGKLKKVDVTGGPALPVADVRNAGTSPVTGAWSPTGIIVYAPGGTAALMRVPASGGAPTPATKLQKEQWHRGPSFLPDGKHFLFVAGPPGVIYVGSLDSPDRTMVMSSDSKAIYSKGYLLFNRQNTLLAQPFDTTSFKTTSDSFPVAENVSSVVQNSNSSFAASADGVLIYRTGATSVSAQFSWFDRGTGRRTDVGAPGDYRGLDVSPDGKRIATHQHSDPGGGDDWVLDVERGTMSRFTFDVNRHYTKPFWSPDGSQLIFASTAGDKIGIYRKASSGAGAEEFLTALEGANAGPTNWSKDAKFILYVQVGAETGRDIWALPLDGDRPDARKPFPVLKSEFDEDHASLSPDSRWIVYQSTETGRPEVYVQPFPPSGGKWQISSNGGGQPRWRQDGKEIFYLGPDRKLMAADIAVEGSTITVGTSKPLFDTRSALNGGLNNVYPTYAVVDNGRRFAVAVATKEAASTPMAVVVNWTAGLRK